MRDIRAAALSLTSLATVTLVYARWLHITNATTVALTFLLVVLITATTSRLRVAVMTSMASMLCFNFFFLPPVGTWTIADPQNWVALFAFLAVSLVASRLSHVARARTEEAIGRRDELARLFDLSRGVLVMTASPIRAEDAEQPREQRHKRDFEEHLASRPQPVIPNVDAQLRNYRGCGEMPDVVGVDKTMARPGTDRIGSVSAHEVVNVGSTVTAARETSPRT